MPENMKINGDSAEDAQARVRHDLESCRETARKLAPGAEFALSDDAQYIYGTAGAPDLASERGLVEYALRFANGEEDCGKRQSLSELPRRLRELLEQQIRLNPEGGSGAARLSAELAEHVEARRSKLRRSLAQICHWHKNKTRINVLDTQSEYLLRDVWALPMLRREPHLHLASFWILASASAFEAFLNVLLLDAERGFGAAQNPKDQIALRRCALESCSRFFLQPPQAGRPQKYCSEEHAKDKHENGSKYRARNSRLRASATRVLIRTHGRRSGTPDEIKAAIRESFSPSATADEIAKRAWGFLQVQRKQK